MRMAAGKGSYDWRFDSGRLCLDLVATGIGTSGACELLDGTDRLADWLVSTGLVPEDTRLDAVDDTWLASFRQLRTGVDLLLTAELAGRDADGALERVNELAAGAPPGVRAVRARNGLLVRALSADLECRGAAVRRRPRRRGAPDRPRRAGRAAPLRGRQLPTDLPRHVTRAAAALVLQRGVREPGAGGPAPAPGGGRPRSRRTGSPEFRP